MVLGDGVGLAALTSAAWIDLETTKEDSHSPKEHAGPAQYDFCTTKDVFGHKENSKTRRFWQRVVRAQKETSKNDGFSTATMPKPAEGCPRESRNVKNDGFRTATTPKPAEGCNPDWRCQPSAAGNLGLGTKLY